VESLISGAERMFREEGEIGRAVVGRWVTRAGCAAAHAHRILTGFRREAALHEARASEPLARRVRRYFTRDNPLLLHLELCWELNCALCEVVDNLDAMLGGGRRDELGKEAVLQAARPCAAEASSEFNAAAAPPLCDGSFFFFLTAACFYRMRNSPVVPTICAAASKGNEYTMLL
jgi:hypothetical protein